MKVVAEATREVPRVDQPGPSEPAWASESEVVREAARGSAEAFERLVRRYTRLVFAVCLGVLTDAGACEDAVQEVFLKAMGRLGDLRDNDRFAAWISQIARNHCLDLVRKDRRRRTLLRRHADAEPERVDHSDLHQALASLPETYRVPLVLYYFHGHSARKVAEALGLSLAGACTRLCRARQRLRVLLEERGGSR